MYKLTSQEQRCNNTPSLCLCSLQKRLVELQEQIAQINKEEELFKWTPTTYPQLDQIHSMLEPYQRLFNTVFRWQKADKRLMDGAFLELNAENTEAEVSVLCSQSLLQLMS